MSEGAKEDKTSWTNCLRELKQRGLKGCADVLADAPRRILDRTSIEQASLDECLDVMKDPKRKYDCRHDSSPVEFSVSVRANP